MNNLYFITVKNQSAGIINENCKRDMERLNVAIGLTRIQ